MKTAYYLFYLGFYAYIGKANNTAWRDFKREWRRSQGWPEHCYQCGRRTLIRRFDQQLATPADLTLDHIIPRSLIYELGLYELVYEPINFQLMCLDCNGKKANAKLNTSELGVELLAKYYLAMDRRDKELALQNV